MKRIGIAGIAAVVILLIGTTLLIRQTSRPLPLPSVFSEKDLTLEENAQRGRLALFDAVQEHIHRFTGPGAVDCGVHALTAPGPPSEAALARSVACGLDAVKRGKPFFTFREDYGTDSWDAVGLLSRSDGPINRFVYTDLSGRFPTGGDQHGSRPVRGAVVTAWV